MREALTYDHLHMHIIMIGYAHLHQLTERQCILGYAQWRDVGRSSAAKAPPSIDGSGVSPLLGI